MLESLSGVTTVASGWARKGAEELARAAAAGSASILLGKQCPNCDCGKQVCPAIPACPGCEVCPTCPSCPLRPNITGEVEGIKASCLNLLAAEQTRANWLSAEALVLGLVTGFLLGALCHFAFPCCCACCTGARRSRLTSINP